MAKGENIFKRKDGRWEARYMKQREASGKIKYGYCYGKTYKEAKEKVTKKKAEVLAGKVIRETKCGSPLAVYCENWLSQNKEKLKESTYVKYTNMLNHHIKPKLGQYHSSEITTGIVQQFRDELLYQEGLSPKTVKDILVLLHSILKYVAKQSSENAFSIEIEYPKNCKKEMRVLTVREQECFISYLIHDMNAYKFGILLALYTGIRIGELCALCWDNISLEEKTIRINATMQRLQMVDETNERKTKVIITTPKSDTSVRTIPLPDGLLSFCKRIKPQDSMAYVLTGTRNYIEPRTLQYHLKKYTKECGLEGVHFHTLRHTFATRCIEVGFEIKSLSEILGHSTTTITMDRYVHSSMELKRNNMNKLAGIEKKIPQSNLVS